MRRQLGQTILDAAGWTIGTPKPETKKLVLIAAPHTSNWDFLYALATTTALGLNLRFMAKDSLFRGPQGALFRALGGIAVDRSKKNNLVDSLAHEFTRHESLALLVPAEGTRSRGTHWKSGFYHIAQRAGVPIGLGFLDYRTKTSGIGTPFLPTGNIKADMDVIRAFYADKFGKHHEDYTPPLLREEQDPQLTT
jgi:1-acyl-sn-glycerol-3-phosphate acyltransferase